MGRFKSENTDSIIKVAVSSSIAETFEEAVRKVGKSKSDVLREIIPSISSKSFEEMIPTTSLELLEKFSDECWKIIHTDGCIFEVDNISERMPAFISTYEPPMIHVKYPTFKIQIFSGDDPCVCTDQQSLQELLDSVDHISDVYATKADYLLIGNKFVKADFPFVNEVMCLGIGLEECMRAKSEITELLSKNGFHYSVYPAYCLRADFIELLEEKKYFKVKK